MSDLRKSLEARIEKEAILFADEDPLLGLSGGPREVAFVAFDHGAHFLLPDLLQCVEALEKIRKPLPRPQGANEYQQIMYWSGHALDSEQIADTTLSQLKEKWG